MSKYELSQSSWVCEDGSYGSGFVLTFDMNDLTEEQWETLGELSDTDRIEYVQAILDGDDLSEWEA
jgi:hypothetical protein